MATEQALQQRSNNSCELCAVTDSLSVFPVPPTSDLSAQQCVYICQNCQSQIEATKALDANHWRCLNDSMWSEVDAVKVMVWRMLSRMGSHLANKAWL